MFFCKNMKLLIVSLFLCSLAYGQETVELVDPATGVSSGSVLVRDGEVCSIAGIKYKVKIADSAAIRKLKETLLDSGRFNDVALRDCVAFMNRQFKELNKDGDPIQFFLKTPGRAAGVYIDMDLNKVSFYELLQTICFKLDLSYKIEGNNVYLLPREERRGVQAMP